MHSHRLVLEGQASTAEWLLEWDQEKFVLKDPDGQPAFKAEPSGALRVIELYELYVEGKISLSSPHGSLVFKKNPAAVVAVREFVEARLAEDEEFRSELRRQSLHSIPLGIAMFLIAGGLFGAYCWYASWAPDPPRGHWLYSYGWLVKSLLLLLLGIALAGLLVCYFGLRQWLRIRRIEQAIGTGKFAH